MLRESETEGKQTYVQAPTLSLSSCVHLDKCLHFSWPVFFFFPTLGNDNPYPDYCKD